MSYRNCFFQISIVLIVAIFSVSPAFADVVSEVQVAEIKSEPENNLIHLLKLGLNADNDIETIIRSSSQSVDEWDVQILKTGSIVLARSSDRDALILSCTDSCDEFSGGNMTISYLYNGIWSTYRDKYFYLLRSGDDWELYTDSNELVENLTLVTNTFWGMVIGIKRIDVNAY